MKLLTLALASVMLLAPLVVIAQPGVTLDDNAQRAIDTFDIERAFVSEEQIFVPYHVTDVQRLSDALANGKIQNDMRLVVLERKEGELAFLVQQIAYHHIAQGEMKGKPYMVSF